MRRAIIAVILLLGLLLVPSVASAASGVTVSSKTGDGTWDGNTWKVEMFPGETKSTTIELYNSSTSSLDVEVTIIPDSLDDGNLTFALDKTAFTMSGRSNEDVILTVEASGSAIPGIYTTELEIKSEVPPTNGGGGGGGGGLSALRIYNLTVENITEDSADITWKTSRAATTKLTYWSNPEITVRDESRVKEHLIHLEDLEDNTTYYFKVVCEDRYDLRRSDTGEFTTLEKEVEPESIVPEPEEPVIPEPVLPEPEEPTVPEPEELIEPEPKTPWGLIIGTVVILAAIVGGVVYWRRHKET